MIEPITIITRTGIGILLVCPNDYAEPEPPSCIVPAPMSRHNNDGWQESATFHTSCCQVELQSLYRLRHVSKLAGNSPGPSMTMRQRRYTPRLGKYWEGPKTRPRPVVSVYRLLRQVLLASLHFLALSGRKDNHAFRGQQMDQLRISKDIRRNKITQTFRE